MPPSNYSNPVSHHNHRTDGVAVNVQSESPLAKSARTYVQNKTGHYAASFGPITSRPATPSSYADYYQNSLDLAKEETTTCSDVEAHLVDIEREMAHKKIRVSRVKEVITSSDVSGFRSRQKGDHR